MPCLTPLARTSPDVMDLWKQLSFPRVDVRQMKQNETRDGGRDTFSCYCLVRISALLHFSRPCVWCPRPCLQMRKIGSQFWWIVSYMKTTGGPVIYGVNNGVYSQAWSAALFLFVVRWQKYYSQTARQLYPILIQKPIKTGPCASRYHSVCGAQLALIPNDFFQRAH